jgi:phosphohistidine swiveling domain-containing protein
VEKVRGLGDFGRDDVAAAGGKAANLGELVRAGFPVPAGFVLTTAAYRRTLDEAGLTKRVHALSAEGPGAASRIRALFDDVVLPPDLAAEVAAAYTELGAPSVAVRSSATAEDLPGASFAGQQDTYLDVRGEWAVLDAVRRCWASLWTDRAMAYRAQRHIPAEDVSLAVVVQVMVAAETAGVLFTANPVTGRRTETVISAARGLGEAVVSGTTATEQWVLDLAGRRVVERPVGADPVLDEATAWALAELGGRVAAHFGGPQDVEWAAHDGRLSVLQARPVTALPAEEPDPPTDWSVPDPTSLYVRASIVEQLPDPLSPLFADLVDPAVTRSLTELMEELIGPGTVRPGDVALPTVNGYAYYRYGRSGMVRITLRAVRALPVLTGGRRNGRERWRTRSRPLYGEVVAGETSRDPAAMTAVDLVEAVETLLHAGAQYYTAVQTLIPVAALSEVVFSRFYELAVRRPGGPPPAAFLLGFDSLPIQAEKSLHDLAGWAQTSPGLSAAVLASRPGELLADRLVDGGAAAALWPRLQEHLDRFGHMVYDLDPVNPVPADDPAPLLETLRYYLDADPGTAPARDPYARQARSAAAREQATAEVRARLDPVRRSVFDRLLRWAQGAAPVREDALADVGLAWPQLRRLLAELGRRAAAAGVVDEPADVHWLRRAELVAALVDGDPTPRRAVVAERKALWRARRRVTPPQVLPVRRWARLFRGMLPASTADQSGDVLTGLAGSAGRVTALARVLAGPADFATFRAGEVLVAPITTPAWTTLFVRAAAVVTDVGGPLSHSSIVAREYGIPAVLGTAVATARIRTGQRVTVDGDAGTVTLLPDLEAGATPARQPDSGSWAGAGPR